MAATFPTGAQPYPAQSCGACACVNRDAQTQLARTRDKDAAKRARECVGVQLVTAAMETPVDTCATMTPQQWWAAVGERKRTLHAAAVAMCSLDALLHPLECSQCGTGGCLAMPDATLFWLAYDLSAADAGRLFDAVRANGSLPWLRSFVTPGVCKAVSGWILHGRRAVLEAALARGLDLTSPVTVWRFDGLDFESTLYTFLGWTAECIAVDIARPSTVQVSDTAYVSQSSASAPPVTLTCELFAELVAAARAGERLPARVKYFLDTITAHGYAV
jgi:hypothetical protein